MSCSMKQIGARNLGFAVEQMQWSNKMDLIAFGNDKGEIIVQRLNWQRVVTFPSLGDNISVRSLSWQWDEPILAAGYSDGKVSLLDIEREEQISSFDYKESIKNLYFSKAINTADYRNKYRNRKELTHSFFLPQLPQLSTIDAFSKSSSNRKTFPKISPCFLVVILSSGKVHLLLLGSLKAGNIDLSNHVSHPDDFKVCDVHLSADFEAIYALVCDGNQLKLLHFQNTILRDYISPMLCLARHCANVSETKTYINDTIQSMLEAWETVLLEMDNKLTKYANQQSDGSLCADFLELLVFGYATNEIEDFLMDDLTEKGLKKLANSVDLSYSTIQTLVAKPLLNAAINMFYFLNTIKGLGRINYFFDKILSIDMAEMAVRKCGAFLMKVLEFQQIIDQCVNDMKLFFSWLCVVIVRLHQQEVTEDMTQLTPEETIYLAEYLNSFEDSIIQNDDGTVTKRKFNLEKVGQYLENKSLPQPLKSDMHHLWKKLLEDNECMTDCSLLYPHENDVSLIQQRDMMLDAIDVVFKKPDESISANFMLNASVVLCNISPVETVEDDFIRTSYYVNNTTKCDMIVTTVGWQEALILEFDKTFTKIQCVRLLLKPGPFNADPGPLLENLRFVDLQFYNENTISLLLRNEQEKPQCYFLQFAMSSARDKSATYTLPNNIEVIETAAIHRVFEKNDSTNFKVIDALCTNIAVSGSRKVATILSENRKKMTIFEMEIEDDEEDTEISQSSLLEISKESATLE